MIRKQAHLPVFPLYAWSSFMVLFPFYLFGSGMPQPADWVLAMLLITSLFQGAGFLNIQIEPVRYLRYFVIYVVVVNTLWALFIDQSHEKRFPSYFHSLFYIYNFMVFAFTLMLYRRYGDKFLLFTAYGIGLSVILQVALSVAGGGITSRDRLFFNNPNQLGYYALLAGSILAFMTRMVKLPMLFQIASYMAFLYLCLISASKAALAGAGMLIILSSIDRGLLNFKQIAVLGIVAFSSYYFISKIDIGITLFDYAFNRFQTIGESSDDSVEGRGYDRMLNNPGYMVFGAGEGGYYRFDTMMKSGEIHSSFGTILFCYGVVGLTIFIIFLFNLFRKSSFFEFLYVVPVFAYSITHQGLRVTLFWIFLALIFIQGWSKTQTRVRRKKPFTNIVKHSLIKPISSETVSD